MDTPIIFVPLKKIEPNKRQNSLIVKVTINNELPVIMVVEAIQSRKMFCKNILFFICS
jgi:hypothetical protein